MTRAYAALLDRLDTAPWATAVTALWVLERVYLLAWGGVVGAGGPYAVFVEHWTAPGFAAYVAGLEQVAVAAAGEVDGDEVRRACAEVLELEAAFWDAGAAA